MLARIRDRPRYESEQRECYKISWPTRRSATSLPQADLGVEDRTFNVSIGHGRHGSLTIEQRSRSATVTRCDRVATPKQEMCISVIASLKIFISSIEVLSIVGIDTK